MMNLRNFISVVGLLFLLIPLSSYAGCASPPCELPLELNDLRESVPNLPCHTITPLHFTAGTSSALGFPNDITQSGNSWDIRTLRYEGPNFTRATDENGHVSHPQGLEWVDYQVGQKYTFVPVFEGNKTDKFYAWIVYRHKKAKQLMAQTVKKFTTGTTKNVPIYQPDYNQLMKASRKMDSWLYNSHLQTPYYQDVEEGSWVQLGLNVPEFRKDSTVRYFVYEACERVDIITPSGMQAIQNTFGCQEDLGRPQDYISGGRHPSCLAKRFLSKASSQKLEDYLGIQEATIRFIGQMTPIVGRGFDVANCLENSNFHCWADTASGLTADIGTLLVPVGKVSTFGKAMVGVSIAADVTSASFDYYNQNYLEALNKIAGATFNFVDIRNLKVGDVGVASITKRKGQEVPPCKQTCNELKVEKQKTKAKSCDKNQCGIACATLPRTLDDVAKKYELTDAEKVVFNENRQALEEAARRLRDDPASVPEYFLSLGTELNARDFPQLRAERVRQWGNLKIAEFGKERSFEFFTLTQDILDRFYQRAVRIADETGMDMASAFDKSYGELMDTYPAVYLRRELASQFTRVRVKPASGTYRELSSAGLPHEREFAEAHAKRVIEEMLHGMDSARLPERGMKIPAFGYDGVMTTLMPHTPELEHFNCWLNRQSEDTLLQILGNRAPVPERLAENKMKSVQEWLKATILEANIAIWLKNSGKPFNRFQMEESYPVRKALLHWYEKVERTPYYAQ